MDHGDRRALLSITSGREMRVPVLVIRDRVIYNHCFHLFPINLSGPDEKYRFQVIVKSRHVITTRSRYMMASNSGEMIRYQLSCNAQAAPSHSCTKIFTLPQYRQDQNA